MAVLLHSGSITGPTIGTSESVFLPYNFNGFVDFLFDAPPSVASGTQYYFQPVVQSGTDAVVANYSDGYNYATREALFQGAPGVASDLWFREGIIVPEPSAGLAGSRGGGIYYSRRKTS